MRSRKGTIPRKPFLFLWLLFVVAQVTLAESQGDTLPASLVTSDILQAEIAATEAATDLTDEARDRLIQLYHETLRNLEIARSNQETAPQFHTAAESAPSQIQQLHAIVDQDADPVEGLDGDAPVSFE